MGEFSSPPPIPSCFRKLQRVLFNRTFAPREPPQNNHPVAPTRLNDFDLTTGQVRAIETTATELARTTLLGPKAEVWAVESYRHLAVALVIHDFGHSIIWVQREATGDYTPRPVMPSGQMGR